MLIIIGIIIEMMKYVSKREKYLEEPLFIRFSYRESAAESKAMHWSFELLMSMWIYYHYYAGCHLSSVLILMNAWFVFKNWLPPVLLQIVNYRFYGWHGMVIYRMQATKVLHKLDSLKTETMGVQYV